MKTRNVQSVATTQYTSSVGAGVPQEDLHARTVISQITGWQSVEDASVQ